MITKNIFYFSLSLIVPLSAYAADDDKFQTAFDLCKDKIAVESSKLSIDAQYKLLDKFYSSDGTGKARLCIARHKVLPRGDKAAFAAWLDTNGSQ